MPATKAIKFSCILMPGPGSPAAGYKIAIQAINSQPAIQYPMPSLCAAKSSNFKPSPIVRTSFTATKARPNSMLIVFKAHHVHPSYLPCPTFQHESELSIVYIRNLLSTKLARNPQSMGRSPLARLPHRRLPHQDGKRETGRQHRLDLAVSGQGPDTSATISDLMAMNANTSWKTVMK